jgi:hypothetical protein
MAMVKASIVGNAINGGGGPRNFGGVQVVTGQLVILSEVNDAAQRFIFCLQ